MICCINRNLYNREIKCNMWLKVKKNYREVDSQAGEHIRGIFKGGEAIIQDDSQARGCYSG
jgi:hypothetical protein